LKIEYLRISVDTKKGEDKMPRKRRAESVAFDEEEKNLLEP
jgi:hypothetical protein